MSPSSIVYRMPKHVVLWMCSAVAFAQSSTDPDDHGNDPSAAAEVSLGQTAAGAIDPGHDEDYFRLELEQRATVVVAVTGIAEFGALIDADGEVVSEMERLPGRSELQLRGDLDAGTYYVAVGSGEMTGRYEIVMREPDLGDR